MKTAYQRFSIFLAVMLMVFECHAQEQNAAQDRKAALDAWVTIMEKVLVRKAALPFQFLPEDKYAVTIKLAQKWNTMEYQPSTEDIKKFWKERGPKDRELTESMYLMVARKMQRLKFIGDNKDDLETIRRLAGKNLYDNLVKTGVIDPKSPATFVFIPLPCPRMELYKKAATFMDSACDAALERHLKVVIVRSYYGNEQSIRKPLARDSSWNDQILRMPAHYDKYIEAGVVKIMDSFPGLTCTPWGFLFRKGQFWDEGNIAEWADDSKFMLEQFNP